jgi:hypothetical protein
MVIGINNDTGEVALDHAGELSDKAGDRRHYLVLHHERKVEVRRRSRRGSAIEVSQSYRIREGSRESEANARRRG